MHHVAGPPVVSTSRTAALEDIAAEIRRDVVDALEHAGHEHRGHPGASLSIVDLDLGMLRCVPDLVILNPADAIETRQLVRAAADHQGPVYIRLGRDDSPVVGDGEGALTIGPGRILVERGWDAALLTSGLITAEVLDAAETLGGDGIACAVIEFPTLKPIDHHLVLRAAGRARHLFTIEEHSIVGGLGSAVADVLADRAPVILNRIGTGDVFLESGSPPELRAKYGLTAGAIAARVRQVAGAPRP